MTTTRRRHLITETDEVAKALDDAARKWPEEGPNRARLLVRLVKEGHRAVTKQSESAAAARRDAVARTSGVVSGAFGADYLDDLRREWSE